MRSPHRFGLLALVFLTLSAAGGARAAGTLTPVGSPDAPIQIRDHHADVVINNGVAKTEVTQTFFNPNAVDLEAIYAFPVPRSASLSEVTVVIGESEIHGEVVARDEAERIYEEERSQGNDAGLASKNGYQTFEFRVSPVRAQQETRLRFVYYQPLEIDTGIGRYVYPLETSSSSPPGPSRTFACPASRPRPSWTHSARVTTRSASSARGRSSIATSSSTTGCKTGSRAASRSSRTGRTNPSPARS
jgi:Ca-activated chloride channel family protein